jgi:hypothetical protein
MRPTLEVSVPDLYCFDDTYPSLDPQIHNSLRIQIVIFSSGHSTCQLKVPVVLC